MRRLVFMALLALAVLGVAQATDTPGEVLQLALLGVALVLLGARLRVVALRRWHGSPPPGWRAAPAPARPVAPAPARPTTPAPRRATPAPSRRRGAYPPRDDWPFPDPCEPAPTGLLPSTAGARRRARALAMSGDRS